MFKGHQLTIEWADRQAVPWTMHGSPAGSRLDRWEESPAMYLIMPDRFANGDPSNDTVEGMREQGVDRTEMYARHGGDLQGIPAHLPYLKELGVDAIWLTPVVENDLAKTSYHGYACTDGYAIDRRLGSLDDYKSLVQAAHAQGIRMVHDWVPNHWGNLHRLLTHPVDSTWVNRWSGGFDESKRTNYRGTTLFDPYGNDRDVKEFNEGWFDRMMPDMNQTNEDLQQYMGTNMLWLMAEVGIDGLRIDTYTYGNAEAMARMTKRIANAFPRCFMFAEAWVYGSAKQAALVEGSAFGWGQETGLDGAVDFAWHFAMQEAVHQGESWSAAMARCTRSWLKTTSTQTPTVSSRSSTTTTPTAGSPRPVTTTRLGRDWPCSSWAGACHACTTAPNWGSARAANPTERCVKTCQAVGPKTRARRFWPTNERQKNKHGIAG